MKRLLLWTLALCLLAGCGADTPSAKEEEAPLSPVYTDWSHLTPYEATGAVYILAPGYQPGSGLTPRADYGMLLPYVGADLRVNDYITDHLPRYGLVSAGGKLVTDPIYDSVTQNGEFLILSGGAPGSASSRMTVAAWDGRWAMDWDGSVLGCVCGRMILAGADGGLTFLNPDGGTAAVFPIEEFAPWLEQDFRWNGADMEGLSLDGTDERVVYLVSYTFTPGGDEPLRLYLDLENGTVADTPPEGYPAEINYDGMVQEAPELPGYSYYETLTDSVSGQKYYFALRGAGDAPAYDLLDANGAVVYSDLDTTSGLMWQPIVCAGLFSNMESGCFCYRTLADSSLVFRYPLQNNND